MPRSSDNGSVRTPRSTSASTRHTGSGVLQSGPTNIATCDHVDWVRALTNDAKRVLLSTTITSPGASAHASRSRFVATTGTEAPHGWFRYDASGLSAARSNGPTMFIDGPLACFLQVPCPPAKARRLLRPPIG